MSRTDSEFIVTPILPFPQPENEMEKQLNMAAEALYLSAEAQKIHKCGSCYDPHPEKLGMFYEVFFGWTRQGWRTYATVISKDALANKVELQIKSYEDNVRAELNRSMSPMAAEALFGLLEHLESHGF